MSLQAGARLGPYEIRAPLGAGGMGEVYSATDTNLRRLVAIKVLPDAVAGDAARLARFQREAEILASLNHPHIAQIHGLERSSGRAGLVMELVEGPTLAERIARGPLAVDEALAIARQIAEAIEAAHQRGIVHRDLKPANVKVQRDHQVKVLDFGLARVAESPGSAGPAGSMAPTADMPVVTRAGEIIGTAAYMSPEQAGGGPVDERTDIWAFGCVLYEMLTGRKAFGGENLADALASVFSREPVWEILPDLPMPVESFLRRCLEKDQHRRVRAIGDVRLALEGAFGSVCEAPATATERSSRPEWRARLRLAIVAGLAALVGGVAAWTLLRPRPEAAASRLSIVPVAPDPLRVALWGRSVAISPDGTEVAYLGGTDAVLVRALDALEPRVLVRSPNAQAPFFSADGQWVGYFDGTAALRRVQVTGGPTTVITRSDGSYPGGATWAEDGTVVFATENPDAGLYILRPGETDATMITTPDRAAGETNHFSPEFLPGGQAVLFNIQRVVDGRQTGDVAVLDLGTGRHHVVVRDGSDAGYVSSGHLVYSSSGALEVVPFDLERQETTGVPTRIIDTVTRAGARGQEAQFDVASRGTLVYVPGPPPAKRRLVWVGRDGSEEPVDAPPRPYVYPRVSPDGRRVLLDIRDDDNDIWLLDLERGTLDNVTSDRGLDRFPVWMPDGQRFAFQSTRDGASAIYVQSADGASPARRISDPSPVQQAPMSVSTDGTRLLFDGGSNVMMLQLDAGGLVTDLLRTSFAEYRSALSPDDRWLSYVSNESGPPEVYVRPFPDISKARIRVSIAGGVEPRWSPSGDELFYFALSGELMRVTVDRGPTWSASRPEVALTAGYLYGASGASAPTFDLSPDGRRFLMIKGTEDAGQSDQIVVVQHWVDEVAHGEPVS